MEKKEHTTNELLTKFNAGDMEVYELVFRLNYQKMCYFADTIVNEGAASEDIVQNVFVKLWQMKKNFESFEKITTFLYVAVRNSSINLTKSRSYRNHSIDDTMKIVFDDNTMENIYTAEMLATLKTAIDTLPKECRKVMNMVLEGYSLVEIAAILHLAPSSVNAQKARGLKLLKPKISNRLFLLLLLNIKL